MGDTKDKKQYAYDIIKTRILEGEMPPLSDISEEQLQKELGISRTPVREAIIRLQEDGFVQIYPRKGTIVTDITLDVIHWTYEVRELLEPSLARGACGKLAEAWLIEMKDAFNRPYETEGRTELQVRRHYIELDRALHGTILSTCRNAFIRHVMEQVYDHSHRIRMRTSMANRAYSYSIQEHCAILQALLDNDPDAAEQAVRQHLKTATGEAFRYN